MSRELDWSTVPLRGWQQVEAGAGTGKTHAIIRLYLRLLLESGLSVDRILVLTFTRAATAELRSRIYHSLTRLHRGVALAEADQQLRAAAGANADKRIAAAVECFEEASIYTIHAFCQRILSDHAFACGLSFNARLEPDRADPILPLAQDFWRRHIYHAGPLLAGLAMRRFRGGPGELYPLAAVVPGLQILTAPAELPPLQVLDQDYTRHFRAAAVCWQQDHAGIYDRLTDAALNRNRYPLASLAQWCAELHGLFSLDVPTLELPDHFAKFTVPTLVAATRRAAATPQHAFFRHCETLQKMYAHYMAQLDRLQRQFLEGLPAAMAARSRRDWQFSYDDLLRELHDALQHRPGLSERLQACFGAILVDEFQDTDMLQYRILQACSDGTQPVFLVGDPRQAIYSFRGADVYAYLTARRDVDQQYTLTHNRRSVPGLVEACNALFSGVQEPFLEAGIEFLSAHATTTQGAELQLEDAPAAALQLWWCLDREATIRQLERRVATAIAGELVRLLTPGNARLGERPLVGRDIAILVRTHRQAALMRAALQRSGIGNVLYNMGSVYSSRMAEELLRLLLAVATPGRTDRVRSALSTLLLGVSAQTLEAADDATLDGWWQDFRRWHELWDQQGFMRMFRQLLYDCDAHSRLAAGSSGARDLTDLRHLAELLQAVDRQGVRSISATVQWFALRCSEQAQVRDAERLRLESDEQLVRIITIHHSKGLEYPVVFCPFLWKSMRLRRAAASCCHDPENEYRAVLALGAQQVHWQHRVQLEHHAEELRLLYVALTRARNRCYVVAVQSPKNAWNGLAGLLHNALDWQDKNRLKKLTEAEFHAGLQRYVERAGGQVQLQALPEAPGRSAAGLAAVGVPLHRRQFQGTLPMPLRVSSYSALVSGYDVEYPDRDAVTAAAGVRDTEQSELHSFPQGARTGHCLHTLLEQLDFSATDQRRLTALVSAQLRRHDFDAPRWTPVIVTMLQQVLDAELRAGIRLRELSATDCLKELEFYFRLRALSVPGLRAVLSKHAVFETLCADAAQTVDYRLQFAPVSGYVRGFIDLVFVAGGRYYVVDYKSNRLGGSAQDYTGQRILQSMLEGGYVLQYLLYTVALHRHLRVCLPGYRYDTHFGGVRYLFLRGMQSGSSRGVFQHRPAAALVADLDAYLDTVEEGGAA